jgi:HAD superfamily hydrolase (TIGR01459 family)
MTRIIPGLGAVAGRYDVLLCDIWGVVHNGREAFPAACAALTRWREVVGQVILISNAPRPWAGVAAQLDVLSVPREAWSAIVTSGDASRELLAARAPGPAWRIGPAKDDPLFDGLGLEFSGPEGAAFIACTGPNDEDNETPEDYREVLTYAAGRDVDMICANPDLVVQRGDSLIYCAGALARLYESVGGRVIEVGKPYTPIYDLALTLAGPGVDRARVLAIGDGLHTDLAGAAAHGFDALFVAGGVHAAEILDSSGAIDEVALRNLLGDNGAAFAIAALVW